MTQPWGPNHEVVHRVDFSQLHMGDHRPFGRECYRQYGGPRRHLWLAWTFHYRDKVFGPFRRLLLCPLGRHTEYTWRSTRKNGTKSAWVECADCHRQRFPSEKELEDFPEVEFRLKED